jgi:uncharacterized protein (DUF924 family)
MTTPLDVLSFWFADGPDTYRDCWFKRSDAFDTEIRIRFAPLVAQARTDALESWRDSSAGVLALCILLDQFCRNLHRGSAEAFTADPKMLAIARDAVLARRIDIGLTPVQRIFLYLPFEHSEAMANQDLSVALFEGLRDDARMAAPGGPIDYAWRHRAVIQRFGRFPHRNAALGRTSTPAETAWLAAGGGF